MIDAGCTHVFLEKPGAPTVGELEDMASYASSKGVGVFMGYNKNVTKYVTEALAFAEGVGPSAATTFCANNAYKREELDECFERNSEGMLKNMAVHELGACLSSSSSCVALRRPSVGRRRVVVVVHALGA